MGSRRCSFERPIQRVAVVGGTHGNELHGLFLVREMEEHLTSGLIRSRYPSLSLQTLVANPAAVVATGTGQGRRYVERDLNRCFLLSDLENNDGSKTLEDRRAREIDQLLGPKSSPDPATDFIIDLHSTTANTGVLILCHPDDLVTVSVAHALRKKYSEVSLGLWSQGELPLLPTVGRSGLTLEVGAIAHSTTVMRLYSLTRSVLFDMLGVLEEHNARLMLPNPPPLLSANVDAAQRYCAVGFPRNEKGNIVGFIHPSIQGMLELSENSYVFKTSPIFELLNGEILTLENCSRYCQVDYASECFEQSQIRLFPQFINEAAYYEKNIAMLLTTMVTIKTKAYEMSTDK